MSSEAAEHRYGDEGVWAFLGVRMERGVHDEAMFQRDPAFIERVLTAMEWSLGYWDPEVRGIEDLPGAGPCLVVANHCGGMYMPDAWVFMTHLARSCGVEREAYALAYDLPFSVPGVGSFLRRVGCIPASPANARAALERKAVVLVYPGGDHDAYRPWVDRNHIDLHGHKGFVRLALETGVPVVPMVSHGSHETIIVLWRGERLARFLGLDRLRVNIFPVVLGLPWGVSPAFVPSIPLPARVTVRLLEPFDWSGLAPHAASDEEVVEHCYEEVLGRMQAGLDELVE